MSGGCGYCRVVSATLLCGGCGLVKYCDKGCQTLHWKAGHKLRCKEMKASGVGPPVPGTATADKPSRERGNCWTCGADNPIHVCTSCQVSKYCGVACQTENWPHHKGRCKELAGQVAEFDASKVALKLLAQGLQGLSQDLLNSIIDNACMLGRLADIQRLVAGGANVNSVNEQGATPMHVAAQEGHFRAVELLVQHGALIETKDPVIAVLQIGRTVLHMAAQCGHHRVIEVLVQHGAVVNGAGAEGTTALMLSAKYGHLKATVSLLAHGALPDITSNNRTSPLSMASQEGHIEVVTLLLQKGASVDLPTAKGLTPLILAAFEGHTAIVRVLLDAGADPRHITTGGSTPVDAARLRNHPDIVVLLEARIAELEREHK